MAIAASTRSTPHRARWLVTSSRYVWEHSPRRVRRSGPALTYGRFVQRLVRSRCDRTQNPRTFFLRNRAELDVLATALDRFDGPVTITVIACSMGAEPYSILWTIRQRRPELDVKMVAIDILPDVVEIAREGWWDGNTDHIERLTPDEIDGIFDRIDGRLRVKAWLREAVRFEVGDGTADEFIRRVGPQNVVVANRFLTHMRSDDAARALR